ncbi:MAG: hypothetical protein IPK15_27175 [Verrucomicrobia bacterium]|nr:hypothetical protein [Verrucomicrobiota bacterium]
MVLAYGAQQCIGSLRAAHQFVEVYVDRTGGKLSQRDYFGVYVLVERIKHVC